MARLKRKKRNSAFKLLPAAFLNIFKRPIVLAWLFATGSLIVLTAMSVPKLRAAHLSPAEIAVEFNSPPEWLDDSLLHELQNTVRVHLANAPVGRDGLIDASQALLESGWFSDIHQVKWTNNQSASIDAAFLIPYAKIEDQSGSRFIDPFGRLLPGRLGLIVKENYHFITLQDQKFDQPSRPGMQWDGEDVAAGLILLQLFYDNQWCKQIQSINLSKWDEQQYLMFKTTTPSQFLWGSSPNEERGLEAIASQKLERLDRAFATHGKIDQGISGNFDLTHTSNFFRLQN